jgi:hypothetical protein
MCSNANKVRTCNPCTTSSGSGLLVHDSSKYCESRTTPGITGSVLDDFSVGDFSRVGFSKILTSPKQFIFLSSYDTKDCFVDLLVQNKTKQNKTYLKFTF